MKRFIMIIMFLLGSFAVGQNTNVYVPLTNTIEQNAVYYTPEPVYYAKGEHGVCPSGCIEGECSCWKWTGNHWTHNGLCDRHGNYNTPLTMDTGTIVAVTILLGMYYLYLKSKEQ